MISSETGARADQGESQAGRLRLCSLELDATDGAAVDGNRALPVGGIQTLVEYPRREMSSQFAHGA